MGVHHSVYILINANFNKKNVLNILKKGEKLGFIYSDFIKMMETLKPSILKTEEALERVLYPIHDYKKEYGRILVVRHYDIDFDIFFYDSENNNFKISLGDFAIDGKKDFYASGKEIYYANYQRFIKLGLDLCKDFCIKEIKTEAF